MHQNTVLGIALVLLLLSFPLISLGTEQALGTVWALGLAFIVVGGLIPPVIKFVGTGDADGAEDGGDGGEGERSRYVNYGAGEADTGSGVLPTGRPPDRQPERAKVQRERAKQLADDAEEGDAADADEPRDAADEPREAAAEQRDAADAERPERG